jgi:hypothetical protein
MLRFACLGILIATPALSDDWEPLKGAEIAAALTSRVLQYKDGAEQNFFADGRTLYAAGAGESWGRWWVAGDEYCSSWPPSDRPACYRVDVQGLDLRFTGPGGDVTLGRYIDL